MEDSAFASPIRFSPRHLIWLIALALGYAIYVISQWSYGYIDFGDGNYIYIASRIADGAVVYRDILAPQPPCHLFLGALLVRLSRLAGAESPIFYFRGFSLLLHLATALQIVLLARRAWGSATTGVLAGAIFLYLPIGFWWSLGYQSEPLEMFFLLAMMQCALRDSRAGDCAAGIFAALSGLTNATAAPFLLVLIICMLLRAPRRALRMAVPCIVLVALVTAYLEWWTSGAYLQNVVFNQVGTYPRGQLLAYAWGKLLREGNDVLFREGVFLVLGLLGLIRFIRLSPLEPTARAGLGWFCAATLGSIIYVSKGGTADYIFSLSEPALAIMGAGELLTLLRRVRGAELPALAWVGFVVLTLFALLPGIDLHRALYTHSAWELDAPGAAKIRHVIERESRPDQPILAPPFYAVLARRKLLGEYSEIFIWTISYYNDRQTGQAGQGVQKIEALAAGIRARQPGIVLLEMDQTGRIPEIMTALRQAYQPIRPDLQRWIFPTLNTRLGAFVPVRGTPAEVNAAWSAFEAELRRVYGDGVIKFNGWLR